MGRFVPRSASSDSGEFESWDRDGSDLDDGSGSQHCVSLVDILGSNQRDCLAVCLRVPIRTQFALLGLVPFVCDCLVISVAGGRVFLSPVGV